MDDEFLSYLKLKFPTIYIVPPDNYHFEVIVVESLCKDICLSIKLDETGSRSYYGLTGNLYKDTSDYYSTHEILVINTTLINKTLVFSNIKQSFYNLIEPVLFRETT